MAHTGWWQHFRAWWFFQRGLMLRWVGHRTVQRAYYQAASDAFSAALALAPDYEEVHLARGLLYWRELQRPDLAVADFSALLGGRVPQAELLFFRAMAYQAQGEYAAAAADLRIAVDGAAGLPWRRNAAHQLQTIEAILEDLPPQLSPPTLPPGIEPM